MRLGDRQKMRTHSQNAAELLEHLVTSGVQLRIHDGDLQVRGLTDELRGYVKENREGLINLLELGEHDWLVQAEWHFKFVRVPSQIEPGATDLWVWGTRQDKEGFAFWFAGREHAERKGGH